jgi:SulP family sulfate permease
MAFAIASGVAPQAGLYCAVVAGFLISALGGSTTQIGGPTGAFVVVVYGIVARYGLDGLFMCTLMAGVMLVILGVTGLGTAVKFVPRPVVVGFTNGITVIVIVYLTQNRYIMPVSCRENYWSIQLCRSC